MTLVPSPARIWLKAGITNMQKGIDGLSLLVQDVLQSDPFSGHMFVFRGKRSHMVKLLWYDGQGMCLYTKRLERGRFVWPQVEDGKIQISNAQLSMLMEGIDWRSPVRTDRHYHPTLAG
jgi:transposase